MADRTPKEKEPEAAPTYPISELTAKCKVLFKCNPEIISGAISGITKTEFTVDEMRGLIEKFMKKKVNS